MLSILATKRLLFNQTIIEGLMTSDSPSQNCIAWFKLAEYVERKEKEKALALYRLLATSINNDAFGMHLLGALHQSFNDTQEAKDKFNLALDLYYESNPELVIFLRENIIVQEEKPEISNIEALAKDYLNYYAQDKHLLNQRIVHFIEKLSLENKNHTKQALLEFIEQKNNDSKQT